MYSIYKDTTAVSDKCFDSDPYLTSRKAHTGKEEKKMSGTNLTSIQNPRLKYREICKITS